VSKRGDIEGEGKKEVDFKSKMEGKQDPGVKGEKNTWN